MNIRRRAVSATLAITLIGIAPAWSQSLLKTLDPDNDGTVDLTEAKTAAGKPFDKLDRDSAATNSNLPISAGPRSGESFSSRQIRSVSRQRKHSELAAQRCIVLQGSIATNGTQALGGFREAGGKTDAGPAADAGQDRNVLLATMLIGGHVSDDAGRRLELVEFLARLGVDGLEIAFERAVEHHAAGGRQGTRPHRKQLFVRPDDLAGLAVPG